MNIIQDIVDNNYDKTKPLSSLLRIKNRKFFKKIVRALGIKKCQPDFIYDHVNDIEIDIDLSDHKDSLTITIYKRERTPTNRLKKSREWEHTITINTDHYSSPPHISVSVDNNLNIKYSYYDLDKFLDRLKDYIIDLVKSHECIS